VPELLSLMPFQRERGLKLVKGRGQYVWDDEGRMYLDAHTGHGAAFLGHTPPRVVEALARQMRELMVATPVFDTEVKEEALKALSRILPKKLTAVYLQNSGAEAVELALKIAAKHTGRRKIIAFKGGFHGRTAGALSVTWSRQYREGFKLLPGIEFASFNSLEAADLIDEETAAAIVEPIQGEGGVKPATREFLREVSRACSESQALLILDEVQSGFGRSGEVWAHQKRGVTPDIMVAGKSIGGGFPVSLVAAREELLASFKGGDHGSTHGGNPLALAAVKAGVETLLEENVPKQAMEKGSALLRRLKEIESRIVREVRGEGLMIGIELRFDPTPLVAHLQSRGVLALKAAKTVLRLLPPYLITSRDIEILAARVEEAIRHEEGRRGVAPPPKGL